MVYIYSDFVDYHRVALGFILHWHCGLSYSDIVVLSYSDIAVYFTVILRFINLQQHCALSYNNIVAYHNVTLYCDIVVYPTVTLWFILQ